MAGKLLNNIFIIISQAAIERRPQDEASTSSRTAIHSVESLKGKRLALSEICECRELFFVGLQSIC